MADQVEIDSSRLTAEEIYEGATQIARDELNRSPRALAFSGFLGGLTMGLTGLAVAIVRAATSPGVGADFVAWLFYPIGFIAVIIGRAQLFTENTRYPVVLVLRERHHVGKTVRLWGIVFLCNVLGALGFALLVTRTSALAPEFLEQLTTLGKAAVAHPASQVFWTGILGGWLIALVAWMVTASQWTIGQIVVVWLLTFVVGVGRFAHCIATSGEILSSVVAAQVPTLVFVRWLAVSTAGNIVGGVGIVSLWGQAGALGLTHVDV